MVTDLELGSMLLAIAAAVPLEYLWIAASTTTTIRMITIAITSPTLMMALMPLWCALDKDDDSGTRDGDGGSGGLCTYRRDRGIRDTGG